MCSTKAASLPPRSGSSVRRTRSQPYAAHTVLQMATPAETVRHDDEERRLSITSCITSVSEPGKPS